MNDLLDRLLNAVTPWRHDAVQNAKAERTEQEVQRSEVARSRLMKLSESYRMSGIILEERRK